MLEHKKSLPGRMEIKTTRLGEQSGSTTYMAYLYQKKGLLFPTQWCVYTREVSMTIKDSLLEELQLVETVVLEGFKKKMEAAEGLLDDGWVVQ